MNKHPRKAASSACLLAIACAALLTPTDARADEGGVSFWLPGQYGSLIAGPQEPGWALGAIYLHSNVDGDGAVAASRQVTIGDIPRDIDISLNLVLDAKVDLVFIAPAYTFAEPVLGGQLTLGAGIGFGYAQARIDGELTVVLDDGTVIVRQGRVEDDRTGVSDLYPSAQLRWNDGVHNYMAYVMGDIPIGTYDADRLANLGIGHGAIDGGVAYTYFNPGNGREFSAATGLTYNFENEDTDYRNGIDWHLDWAASQFLSPEMHIGVSGYFYQQLTDDEGGSERLGGFKSSVIAIGPQMGLIVPIDDEHQGYLNFKGFAEFDAENRAEGWSIWLTFAVAPHAEHH